MKTLYLTVSKKPFEVMVTGEKPKEFRKPTKWIHSRLWQKKGEVDFEFYEPKEYDVVKITNGYIKNSPYFIAEFKGFIETGLHSTYLYSNGLKVITEPRDIIISIGEIIEVKNYKLT